MLMTHKVQCENPQNKKEVEVHRQNRELFRLTFVYKILIIDNVNNN